MFQAHLLLISQLKNLQVNTKHLTTQFELILCEDLVFFSYENIPATQLTTSLCCRMLCTILPSFRDMTWKLFSQLPHEIKKFSDGVCIIAKHCAPSSIYSAKGLPIFREERMSEPIPKKGSCKNSTGNCEDKGILNFSIVTEQSTTVPPVTQRR